MKSYNDDVKKNTIYNNPVKHSFNSSLNTRERNRIRELKRKIVYKDNINKENTKIITTTINGYV